MYPIVKFCGRVPLIDMFKAQRELMTTYAPGKPTFQWIETSKMTGECTTMQITPQIVNAESWLAVAGGACGLGYFTNSWTGALESLGLRSWRRAADREDGGGRPEARARALRRSVRRHRRAVERHGCCEQPHAERRGLRDRGQRADHATTIPFRVDALAPGRPLTVLDEGRTISPVKKIYFRDSFGPYQVHLYMAAP